MCFSPVFCLFSNVATRSHYERLGKKRSSPRGALASPALTPGHREPDREERVADGTPSRARQRHRAHTAEQARQTGPANGNYFAMGWLRQKAIARSDPLCRRPALRGPSVRAARSEAPAPAEVASPPAAPLLLLLGALVFDDL